jgi:hypothetical protein
VAFPGLLRRYFACKSVATITREQVGKETKGIGETWCFLFSLWQVEGGLFSSCDVDWGGIDPGHGTGLLWYAMHINVPRGRIGGIMGFFSYYRGTRRAVMASPLWRSTWIIIDFTLGKDGNVNFQQTVIPGTPWFLIVGFFLPTKGENPGCGAAQTSLPRLAR